MRQPSNYLGSIIKTGRLAGGAREWLTCRKVDGMIFDRIIETIFCFILPSIS